METRARMSPLTAFFLGLFGVGAVGIAAGTTTVLYGMRIVDNKASALIGFAGDTVEGLPDLMASLPPAIGDLLHDRRAPEYAPNIDIDLRFVADDRGIRPVLTVTNKGTEIVSMLALRIAALNSKSVPIHDWTEVVATPIAIDDDWRGPLLPNNKRYVVLDRCRGLTAEAIEGIEGAVEIADVRVWEGKTSM